MSPVTRKSIVYINPVVTDPDNQCQIQSTARQTCFCCKMLDLPKTQKAAVVEKLGGPLEIRNDWPVPRAGKNEVLAKVLYSGVCQSGIL